MDGLRCEFQRCNSFARITQEVLTRCQYIEYMQLMQSLPILCLLKKSGWDDGDVGGLLKDDISLLVDLPEFLLNRLIIFSFNHKLFTP